MTGAEQAARESEQRVRVDAIRCDQGTPERLRRADALVLACPECLGSVAGPMKTLLDQCYYPLLGQIEGRAWSALICAGSDGEGALRLLRRVAAGWRLREVVPALRVISQEQSPQAILGPTRLSPQDLGQAHELGATLAAGLGLGLW
jgi:multimeric flavodoxin WrbA